MSLNLVNPFTITSRSALVSYEFLWLNRSNSNKMNFKEKKYFFFNQILIYKIYKVVFSFIVKNKRRRKIKSTFLL